MHTHTYIYIVLGYLHLSFLVVCEYSFTTLLFNYEYIKGSTQKESFEIDCLSNQTFK